MPGFTLAIVYCPILNPDFSVRTKLETLKFDRSVFAQLGPRQILQLSSNRRQLRLIKQRRVRGAAQIMSDVSRAIKLGAMKFHAHINNL